MVIAGLGLLTPLGHAAWPTFTALLAGRAISDRAERLADAPHPIDPVNLVRALGGVSIAQHASTDPAIELAERAAREATLAADIPTADLPAYLGTSKGAVHAISRCVHHGQRLTSAAGNAHRSAAALSALDAEPFALGPHGYLTQHLQQRLDIVPRRHVVAACASGLTALDRARRALQFESALACEGSAAADPSPASEYALVLSAEAALLPQFVHSYRRLGVLAPLTPADYRQRPLDAHRQGFMLTEAGVAVLLKRLPVGVAPQPGEIELLDTDTACEAHDLVRPHPDMPALAQLAQRLLPAHHPIDVIHPHAPGTPDHDPTELAVYRDALHALRAPDRPAPSASPDLYACKGALGHSLGASGLVALVIACLCLHAGQRPPMPWITDPLPGVQPDARPCDRTGTHAVFAAGFAGHIAGAVIRRTA